MTLFLQNLGYIFWDPDRIFFTLPWIHHPITWYGFFFASGFILGYFIVKNLFLNFLLNLKMERSEAKEKAVLLADKLTTYCVIATVVGARLGHVLFYDFPLFIQSPIEILKIWEGGLASHGAAVGLVLAFFLFAHTQRKRVAHLTALVVLEIVVVAAALAGAFIRLGNFMNQEILGKPTTLFFGVIFGHPFQNAPPLPLHPVQLYEAFFYLAIAILLFTLIKKRFRPLGEGFYSGLFFILVFGFRFFVEFLKLPQSELFDEREFITMGQLLSLPFVIAGIVLLKRGLSRSLSQPQ